MCTQSFKLCAPGTLVLGVAPCEFVCSSLHLVVLWTGPGIVALFRVFKYFNVQSILTHTHTLFLSLTHIHIYTLPHTHTLTHTRMHCCTRMVICCLQDKGRTVYSCAWTNTQRKKLVGHDHLSPYKTSRAIIAVSSYSRQNLTLPSRLCLVRVSEREGFTVSTPGYYSCGDGGKLFVFWKAKLGVTG